MLKYPVMLLFLLFSYLIGSIPWGLVLTKLFTNKDILKQGSGNIGATNVRRIAGNKLGIATFIGDILKGAIPVWLALGWISPPAITGWGQDFYIMLVVFACFFGHLYPIYLKFAEGGKGVATAAGAFLVIEPLACLAAVLTFILLICIFNKVSVGSMGSAAVLPIFVWHAAASYALTFCAVVITAAILVRHKENIKRLLAGKEPPAIK